MNFTVVSTFSGCGGSSLGYQMAGGKVLLAVEWEKHAAETYRLNFPDTPLYYGDICKLSSSEALKITGLKPGELDIFDGSPPCQGFSSYGKRVLDDDRNVLFRQYLRLIESFRPRVFVMENVSGMVTGNFKTLFSEAMKSFKEMGYTVAARVLNAKFYGVPQSRKRLFVVGVRHDIGAIPTHPKATCQPIPLWKALQGIKDEPSKRNTPLPESETSQRALTLKPGTKHSERFNLFRLAWNEIAPCWTKEVADRYYWHPSEHRTFTVDEVKRMCSFPDSFQFPGDFRQAFKRMGNSVPPKMMHAIARHLRDTVLAPCASRIQSEKLTHG